LNQHFIPKFIIEGFVNEDEPGNRGVWVYRASDQRWSKRPTKKTAALEDFYSFVEENGVRDDELEKLMGNIEREAAPFIQGPITEGARLAPPRPFDIVNTFCALLICRNPSSVQRTGDVIVRQAKSIFQEMISSDEKFQEFRRELREATGVDFPNIIPADRPRLLTDFAINATKTGRLGFAMFMLQVLPEILGQMAVTFFHSDTSTAFVTSDLPYAILPGPTNEQVIEQLVVPLSSTLTAVFDIDDSPKYRHVKASASEVRQINATMLSVAREFVISRDPKIFALEPLSRWARSSASERVTMARVVAGV
jgi:hypothetical protein